MERISPNNQAFFEDPAHAHLLAEYGQHRKAFGSVSCQAFTDHMLDKLGISVEAVASPRSVEVLELGKAAHALGSIIANAEEAEPGVEVVIDVLSAEETIDFRER